MIIWQICSKLVLKFVQWRLRRYTVVLGQLLTSCELTARLIESVYVCSTLGHMSNHAAFTRAPWVECFSVMQCMVHSTTLDPGTGAISREWLLGLLCPKPVTCRNELCIRAMPQGPSWQTRGHLICLPRLFCTDCVLTICFWKQSFTESQHDPLWLLISMASGQFVGAVSHSRGRDHWVF